jgi:hypothetical protein
VIANQNQVTPDLAMSANVKERERAFLLAAPLALLPALCVLPAVMFLILSPRVDHGRWIAAILLPLCAVAGSFGLTKISLGAVEEPWSIFNMLCFGTLLVLVVIAGYTGAFLALVAVKL